MESGFIVKLCLAEDTVSLNRSDEIFAFLILPLLTTLPRFPMLSPLREEELDVNRDVEEDLRLGKVCSVSTTEFVVVEFALEELIEVGPSVSSCGISRSGEKFIFVCVIVFPDRLYFG